ncbi:hypothetical protein GBA52_028564 [Prunus armeniaca]|nr:hypothetical protein GBA52_028564 [Prunus armeniaca]
MGLAVFEEEKTYVSHPIADTWTMGLAVFEEEKTYVSHPIADTWTMGLAIPCLYLQQVWEIVLLKENVKGTTSTPKTESTKTAYMSLVVLTRENSI